jgi:hypothetical protein
MAGRKSVRKYVSTHGRNQLSIEFCTVLSAGIILVLPNILRSDNQNFAISESPMQISVCITLPYI